MKSIFRILSIVFSCSLIFSCGPKYTASFGPSQKFYKPDKQYATESEDLAENKVELDNKSDINAYEKKPVIVKDELVASTKIESASSTDKRIKEVADKFKEGGKFDKSKISKMSNSEKRTLLKEAKKDIKALKKQSRISNQKIYIGLIIALAGLVVAILASGSLGGLAVLVGVVLIIWGLIEQGSL